MTALGYPPGVSSVTSIPALPEKHCACGMRATRPECAIIDLL